MAECKELEHWNACGRELPKQVAYILLRYCAQAKLTYWQRNLPVKYTKGPAKMVSDAMRAAFAAISTGPKELLRKDGNIWDFVALPFSMGGMGFHAPVNMTIPQRLAAMAALLHRPPQQQEAPDCLTAPEHRPDPDFQKSLHSVKHPVLEDVMTTE